MTLYRFCLLVLLLGFSWQAEAVSISEVAWMGSQSSYNHEWIELYNAGTAVYVEGWTLTDGMNLSITLLGTIPSNSYVVLERNRSDGGSVVGTPFLNYAGVLVNGGATLTLRRADDSIVDQVVGGENWQNIGGDNTTKETAQYTSNGWVTASPTPGAPNHTKSSNSTAGSSAKQTTAASESNILTGVVTEEVKRNSYAHLPWELDLQIIGPTTVQVNQPMTFRAEVAGLGPTHLNSLVYSWNMGDLTTAGTNEITHEYAYPGTYIVTLYATFAKREAVATKSVTVLPVQFSLARVSGGDVQLYNDAAYDVDVSGFRLVSGGKTVIFPPRSYLTARSTITIPVSRIGNPSAVSLFDQHGNHLASTDDSTNNNVVVADNELISASVPNSNLVPTAANSDFRFATNESLLTAEFEDEDEAVAIEAPTLETDDTDELMAEKPKDKANSDQARSWPYGILVFLMAVGVLAIIAFPRTTTPTT